MLDVGASGVYLVVEGEAALERDERVVELDRARALLFVDHLDVVFAQEDHPIQRQPVLDQVDCHFLVTQTRDERTSVDERVLHQTRDPNKSEWALIC